jgi:hypothetical protein
MTTPAAAVHSYYTVTKGCVEGVNMMSFLNALIEADDIELDDKAATDGLHETVLGAHSWLKCVQTNVAFARG